MEAYLLGLVSDTEKQGVEQMITTHPDLALYVEELEVTLENRFMQGVVPPPPDLRELVKLRADQQVVKRNKQTDRRQEREQPTQSTTNSTDFVDVKVSNTHIQVHKYWRVAFIAVFILGKIFLAFGLYQYFKGQAQEQEIERLNRQIQQQTTPITPK